MGRITRLSAYGDAGGSAINTWRVKMDDHHHPPTSPPTASPRKRRRPTRSPGTPRGAPGPLPKTTWSSHAIQLRKTISDLYTGFAHIPFDNIPINEVLYHLANLRLTFTDMMATIDNISGAIADRAPDYAFLCATKSQGTQTDLPLPPSPTNVERIDAAVETEPTTQPPPPLPRKSYAQAAKPTTSQQPQRKRQPPNAKKTTVSTTSSPTRVIANLQDQPELGIRALTNHELHSRLTEAISTVPNTPSLLGVKWNQKGNLILSYPAGSPHAHIEPQFPAIQSVLQSKSKVDFRFDVPWRRIHLANIWAREDINDPVAPEQELRATLQLNPAIRALNITVQASWLKKPNQITGTHTSAVIAFEDPDGSIERNLLKSTIFAFGEIITTKKWQEKPRISATGRVKDLLI